MELVCLGWHWCSRELYSGGNNEQLTRSRLNDACSLAIELSGTGAAALPYWYRNSRQECS